MIDIRSDAVYNAINSVICELRDRGELDNVGFVIYANPKVCSVLEKYISWTVKGTEIGGAQMNHAFGVIKDSSVPVSIISSNKIPTYTTSDATKVCGEDDTQNQLTKEYFLKIVAYPLNKNR